MKILKRGFSPDVKTKNQTVFSHQTLSRQLKIAAIWRTCATACPMIIDKAVVKLCKADQYWIIRFVRLSGRKPWFKVLQRE
jgi:hypothetical protein